MGGKLGGDNDELMADINITPFVDIILVVLIIFMVTATTIAESSIKVNLPDAASADPAESNSLGLSLEKDGRLLLDGEEISVGDLSIALTEARNKNKDIICLIAADEEVAHGRVVWLIDMVKSLGIAKFAINIDKQKAIAPDPATLGKGVGFIPTSGEAPPDDSLESAP
ncbi:MAG: biopolymer transporter ExbD [Proteobacteria bacterium]|nr:biopolymer transporter ExbD [Pseudomonadota bacterium]